MAEITEKKCKTCNQVKLTCHFDKDETNPDGLKSTCKNCSRAVSVKGIESESQLDSVMREMAELQACINNEEALCQHRIFLVQKYSNEMIEPHLTRQMFLQTLLQSFFEKVGRKNFAHKYRFGEIRLVRGKLKIKLNADLAKQRMGKP